MILLAINERLAAPPTTDVVLTAAGTNIVRLGGHFPPGTIPLRPPRRTGQFQRLCRNLNEWRSPTALMLGRGRRG